MELDSALFLLLTCLVNVLQLSYPREVALTARDFANARKFKDHSSVVDPTTRGKFEGDIDLKGKPIERYTFQPGSAAALGFDATNANKKLWPNKKVPYTVSSKYTPYQRSRIAAAMIEFEAKTCIKFVPRNRQRDYLYFLRDGGCYSNVGKIGGRQKVSLGGDCMSKGVIMHEIMHTLGFYHEQSRADRDFYVLLRRENMIVGSEPQFRKYALRTITHLGAPYDYDSIMHYGPYAFSRNNQPTIVPLQLGKKIGQRDHLSKIDVKQLNALYQCDEEDIRSRNDCQDSRPDCKHWKNSCGISYIQQVCRKQCRRCQ